MGCLNLLYELDMKFIHDMHARYTSCVGQFARETSTEHCFGDRG